MHMNKEQFLEMLQSQQASGLSIKAYCQTNGISVSNFTNWKRKYVLNASSNPSRQLVPVRVQAHRASQTTSSSVVVSFPNGVQVEFASSSDHVAIQMLNSMCTSYV